MGDIKDDPVETEDHLLQPFQRLDIDVIGRLVQKKDRWIAQQDPEHLRFHFLPSGQSPHDPVTVTEIGIQPKLRSER